MASRFAALAVALALAAATPFVCPCAPPRAAAARTPGAHDCCAPAVGVKAVDPGCCGGQSRTAPDAVAADPSAPPSPAVAVLPASSGPVVLVRAARRLAPVALVLSPPPVLRI